MPPQQTTPNPAPTTNIKPHKSHSAMILSILLVIIIIGAGGYSYWQYSKNKTDKANLNAQNATIQAQLMTTKSLLATANATTTTAYYKVPALGLQFPVSSFTNDLYYYANTNFANEPSADFSTQSLIALDPNNCNAGNKAVIGPIGGIAEFKTLADTKVASGPGIVRQINGVYYGYTSPQSTCSQLASPTAADTLETKQIQELKDLFNTATAIK